MEETLDHCLLCSYNSMSNINDSWITVTRGLVNIIECSKQREDGLHEKLLNVDALKVHEECRRIYIDLKKIALCRKRKSSDKADSDSPPSIVRRSTEKVIFNIEEDCLFCALSQKSLSSSLSGRLNKNDKLIPVR